MYTILLQLIWVQINDRDDHHNHTSLEKYCVTLGESAGSALWLNKNNVAEAHLPYSHSLAAPPPLQQYDKKALVSYGFGGDEY